MTHGRRRVLGAGRHPGDIVLDRNSLQTFPTSEFDPSVTEIKSERETSDDCYGLTFPGCTSFSGGLLYRFEGGSTGRIADLETARSEITYDR